MIPAMRASFEEALSELAQKLLRLQRDGFIPEPWLGDPVSAQVVNYYNTQVMEAAEGPYAALRAYQAEMVKVRDNLQILEERYRRTEGDNAALWGRA